MKATRLAIVLSPSVLTALRIAAGEAPSRCDADLGANDEAIPRAIADLLATMPRDRWRRTVVTIVLPSSLSQFKHLGGIAPEASIAEVLRAVEVGAARFFIHGGARFIVAGVQRLDGEWWGAAVDEGAVRAVIRGLRGSHTRVRGFVPAAALIDDVDDAFGPRTADSLAQAALMLPASHPAIFDPLAARRRLVARRRMRSGLFVGILVATVFALLAPGLRASLTRSALERRLARLSAYGIEARADTLRQLRASVEAASALLGPPSALSRTLLALAESLPDESAIVSLRVDARALDLVLLAPAAVEAVEAFDALPGYREARVVGAVTRETIEGRAVQRVALHLARSRTPDTATGPERVVP